MDCDEREIVEYLKAWTEQFISSREICRRAGGKWRFREDPNWALPVLLRMVDKGILESDANGHYRLAQEEKQGRCGWIAPHLRAILQKSGKDFSRVFELDPLEAMKAEQSEETGVLDAAESAEETKP